jgi:hypothetical protein
MRKVCWLWLGLLWPGCCLAEPAVLLKADTLYERPFTDAKVVARLTARAAVDVQKRQGAWYLVIADRKSGWVRMLSVRRTPPPAVAGGDSLTRVATGRAGTGQIVSTTGVRGLAEERLREAPFSEAAVAAAERLRTDAASAGRAAQAAGLAPRPVPALPTPGGAP